MSSLGDNEIKAMVIAGLLLQAGAVAAGFTNVGWRWPLAGATVAIALVVLFMTRPNDTFTQCVFGIAFLSLAAGAGHLASPAPWAAWSARVAFGIEALFQILLLLFLLFFKLGRLF